jgi:hypothetical protein
MPKVYADNTDGHVPLSDASCKNGDVFLVGHELR